MMDIQEYKNSSISSLVQQLNNLGNRQVLTYNTQLYAIQSGQSHLIKRFQTKSNPPRQFFKLTKQSDKKYFYNQIISDLNQNVINKLMSKWSQHYNCSIVLKNSIQKFKSLLLTLQSWIQECLVFGFVVNKRNQICDIFSQNKITHRQLLQNKKYYRLKQQKGNINQFSEQIISYLLHTLKESDQKQRQSFLINLTFKNPESCSELNITLLPTDFFSSQCNPPFSLVKSQILQLLNYIKMNPSKRYQHISKLITKRLPLTNFLTKILMNDSCNLILNHIQSGNLNQFDNQNNKLIGRFQFFDKMALISNLLRKSDRHTLQIGIKAQIRSLNIKKDNLNSKPQFIKSPCQKSRKQTNQRKDKIKSLISPIDKLNKRTQTFEIQNSHNNSISQSQYEKNMRSKQTKQFEYCRSLQRKTHKYSISPRYQNKNTLLLNENNQTRFKKHNDNQKVFENINSLSSDHKKTLSKYNNYSTNIQSGSNVHDINLIIENNQHGIKQNVLSNSDHTESQFIALLKAQHTRQISQYHQTIQLLNKKIMVLTKQLNLQQLYKIHERQIMLLQLKIQQLRDDVLTLTKGNIQVNQKSAKNIIKKLTQQVKLLQMNSTSKKLTQGKFYMIEKQLKDVKQKLKCSEKARTTLTLQVQTLTKRLKIRDTQIQKINQDDLQKYKCQELSVTEEQLLSDIKKLVNAVKNQQRNSTQYLLRKISLVLGDLSKSRDIILQCNDFLVQLMEILDLKLSVKEPQIVLDCNKFIRSFLMENLAIF